jgi:hypothetical protein
MSILESLEEPINTVVQATAPLIAVNTTTKADLLSRAKAAIDAGEQSMHDAAELLAIAQEEHGATQREIAEVVGKSVAWVNALLQWRRSGYKDGSPFGPTTKAGRVQHAEQRAKASKPRNPKPASTDSGSATSAGASTAIAAEAQKSTLTHPEGSTSRKPSPAEAKGNLMYAIKHWWPFLDDTGKVEVTTFFFKQKGVQVS